MAGQEVADPAAFQFVRPFRLTRHTLCKSNVEMVFDLFVPRGGRSSDTNRAVEREHLLAVDHAGGIRGDGQASEPHVVVALEVDGRQALAGENDGNRRRQSAGNGAMSVVKLRKFKVVGRGQRRVERRVSREVVRADDRAAVRGCRFRFVSGRSRCRGGPVGR